MTMVDFAVTTANWDEAVVGFPDANAYQTSGWALAKGPRTSARRVMVREGDDPAAVAQVLIRRIGPGARAGYVPYGPLLADGHQGDAVVSERAMTAIEAEAKRAGCSVLFVQPCRGDATTPSVLEGLGYRPAPFAVATTATLEVGLGRPDEEIFAGLSRKRRRSVRVSGRKGVVIEQIDERHLDDFHRLHVASAKRRGFLPMSADYLRRQWHALHEDGYLRLFLARIDGDARAAGSLLALGPYAEFKITGWDGSDVARRAYANDAVNWAMISWANGAGHRYFDLGGLPRDLALEALRADDPDSTIRRTGSEFKVGWGGRLAIYPPTYEKLLRPLGRVTYRLPSRFLDDRGLGGRLVNLVRRT